MTEAPGARELTTEIYTDGSCSPNPGPGGWGALLIHGPHERELFGGEAQTTNNRMELLAAIIALETLTRPAGVLLHTHSRYVLDGISKYLPGWKARGWLGADRKPVKNQDLWRRLDAACGRHRIEWDWVRGHVGNPGNERADELARRGTALAKAGLAGPGAEAPRPDRSLDAG